MARFFTTEGPVKPDDHYCLPPLQRWNLDEILLLIIQKKYFVLHAPRQTGKTTCLKALRDFLNQQGHYLSVYVNVERAQHTRDDVATANDIITTVLAEHARRVGDPTVEAIRREVVAHTPLASALGTLLGRWAEASAKPIVLLLDEIDSLVGDSLISVLRQLRAGYAERPRAFPQSVVLCGVRDVRDYRIHSAVEKQVITGGSAFNIKAESLRLGDFSRSAMEALYQQHTEETGQTFTPEALDLVWDLTRGQPWLVNALAYRTCFKLKAGRDRTQPITAGLIGDAKEQMILERVTHLDQLTDKLLEPRVRRVIEPLLMGGVLDVDVHPDDVQYVRDLGLIAVDKPVRFANPIYMEVVPRELTWVKQETLAEETVWYVRPDDTLDVPKLLEAFQRHFREHSEAWTQRFAYREAGPHLLLQAFLQRVVNGGGAIEREAALGSGRADLLLRWPHPRGEQRAAIELKLWHNSLKATLAEGLPQLAGYMDRADATEGHLVIFDRRPQRTWGQKIFCRQERHGGYTITVWGM